MAILSKIEQRSIKGRMIVLGLYAFAILGGLSMVVPFVAMVGDSFRSEADVREQGDRGLLPSYIFGNGWLWRKYLVSKYGSTRNLNRIRNNGETTYVYSADIPAGNADKPLTDKERLQADDYLVFAESYAHQHPFQFHLAFSKGNSPYGLTCWLVADLYLDFIRNRFKTIEDLNREYKESNPSWSNVSHVAEPLELKEWVPDYENRKISDWSEFKKKVPVEFLIPVNLDERFNSFLKRRGVKGNQRQHFALETRGAANAGQLKALRLEFARTRVPLRFITIRKDAFVKWLQKRYGTIAAFNKASGENITDWADLDIPDFFGIKPVLFDNIMADYIKQMNDGDFRLSLPEIAFRKFLKSKYQTVAKLNQTYGTGYKQWNDIGIPLKIIDRMMFHKRKEGLRWEFAKRNFVTVSDFLLTNGRAFFNTFVLVVLTLVFTLTVNPLCAYALSRFNLKFTHQILLFCLATMAFPPEVTMIPSFLMLKEFNLLNSFPALFLPGIANGFGIFLLKGFFDSLPDELFDAARIDGCSETKMFWKIALPLTTPVLAVIALNTFAASYGGFLWAYIVCPDSTYWTVMVYLHALTKMGVSVGVQSAGFILATIPPLIVFLACQKIILKGIVVPQMK